MKNIKAMIDLETLNVKPGAIVLSAGVVLFDLDDVNTFEELVDSGKNILFDTKVQIEAGLTKSDKTLAWWAERGEAAREVLNPANPTHPRKFYKELQLLGNHFEFNKLNWYSRGNAFDMSILEAMLDEFNVTVPWKFWKVRCTRTWMEENGDFDTKKCPRPDGMIPHNSLHDAAYEAWMMQRVRNAPEKLLLQE